MVTTHISLTAMQPISAFRFSLTTSIHLSMWRCLEGFMSESTLLKWLPWRTTLNCWTTKNPFSSWAKLCMKLTNAILSSRETTLRYIFLNTKAFLRRSCNSKPYRLIRQYRKRSYSTKNTTCRSILRAIFMLRRLSSASSTRKIKNAWKTSMKHSSKDCCRERISAGYPLTFITWSQSKMNSSRR